MIAFAVLAAILVTAYLFRDQLKELVRKPPKIVEKPSAPLKAEELKPLTREEYIATLPASTRAFYDPNRKVPDAVVAVDYSGFELKDSSQPKVNEVKGGVWYEFSFTPQKPNQIIQASCQEATTLTEVANGDSRLRQASNPTALNMSLPVGVKHAYRVMADRDGRLVVKYSEREM